MSDLENKRKRPVDALVDTMSSIFVPTLPVITAAGILKALVLLAAALGLLSESGNTYYALNFLSNAGFFFLPLILAHSTATLYGGTAYLAVFLAAVLFHPDFTSLVDQGSSLTLFGLSVSMRSYASAIIPGILVGAAEAFTERFFRKIVPDMISFIFVPLLTVAVVGPLALLVLGPAGLLLGDLLSALIDFIHQRIGWPAVAILAAASPVIVTAGVSLCLIPLSLSAIATFGYDAFTRPAFLACNISVAGAAFAVFVKSKIKDNRKLSLQTTFVALMGITEPSLYGVLIPLKRPFIGAILGATVGGAFAGFTNVKGIAYASPSILTLPIFLGDTFVYAVLTCVVSFVAAFLFTWFLGFDDRLLPGDTKSAAGRKTQEQNTEE